MPGPIAEVQRVVDGRGIPVVEDAAHAFGARYHGRPIGSGSPFVCFSLSAVKNVAAGEGGLLCFADAALRPRLEALSWLGLTRDTVTKSSAALNEPARVLTVGYKYRMPDLFAALALAQLDRLEELNSRRRKLASAYLEALSAVPEVELPRVRPQTESSWHMFVIRVPVDARDSLRIALASRDIETSVHYPPLNEEPLFQGGHRTPIAAREARRILTLPLFPDMSLADVTRVCGAICDFFRGER
jgi:UDP-4-amino-4-deoxy-L-arabinose-oxoglutarate aminotransferase